MKTRERYQLDVVAFRDLFKFIDGQGPDWLYLSELPRHLSFVTGRHEAELDLDLDALSKNVAEELVGLLSDRQPNRNPGIPPGLDRENVLFLFKYGILSNAKQAA